MDMDDAAAKFLEGKDVEYSDYYWIWLLGDPIDNIDADRQPSIVFGSFVDIAGDNDFENHAVLLYGYFDDGNWLVHYGWYDFSQVVMNSLVFAQMGGFYSFVNEGSHEKHKPYFDNGSRRMCGCGYYFDC